MNGKYLTAIDMSPSDSTEAAEIISYVENLIAYKFEAGCDDNIKSARHTLDPVFATQRPFLSYFLIFLGKI